MFQVSLNLFLCALNFRVCIFTHFISGGDLFLWTRLCLNVSSSLTFSSGMLVRTLSRE